MVTSLTSHFPFRLSYLVSILNVTLYFFSLGDQTGHQTRTERVKSVDIHPTEPWILASLYNGKVFVYDYETQSQVKTFEVCELPVRAAKFIARKSWIVTGSDDLQIRVYNYNTHERVVGFESHQDYIRALAVHPTQPYVLSSSDDMSIKLWDWDKKWQNIQMFEGHQYFVMGLAINPKDTNTFASASLDKTIKVWNLGSSVANFTLEGHEKGVNYVEYYHGNDKPYLISGADDFTARVWDYQNNNCVQKLTGHTQNVISAGFHPSMPIIYTASEDGSIRLYNSNSYRVESVLNYGLGRVWATAVSGRDNILAFGADEGLIVLALGGDEPSVTMDSSGRVIWSKQNDIQSTNIKTANDAAITDGERLPLVVKDLGNSEIYPQMIQHSPNGRFVVVCGDGEYIIYTALAWRNKSFGSALEFAWAQNSTDYAVRDSSTSIKLFRSFKERPSTSTPALSNLGYSAEEIFGGSLLSIRSAGGTLNLHDWESGMLVRRIDVAAKFVYWSDNGELFSVVTEDSFFVLRYVNSAFLNATDIGVEGVEDAVEFIAEIQEKVASGCWIGSCFIYTNASNRLNYLVGDQTFTIAHFSSSMKLLGYVARDNRVYLADKDLSIVSYSLPLAIIEYQTAILRGEFEMASEMLPSIPLELRPKLARFLEAEGMKNLAMEVTTDVEQQFDLAISLSRLDLACQLAEQSKAEAKWRTVADLAFKLFRFDIAEKSLLNAKDYNSLLMLYSASGNIEGMNRLKKLASEAEMSRLEFVSSFLSRKPEDCLELLIKTEKLPEASLFARTYLPSKVSETVQMWKDSLTKSNKDKAAQSLADPSEYANLFGNFSTSLEAEKLSSSINSERIDSKNYSQHTKDLSRDLVQEIIDNSQSVGIEANSSANPEPTVPVVEEVVVETDLPVAIEEQTVESTDSPKSANKKKNKKK
ncbi:Coatomer subunit beta' [Smittium mucronatum]|uniref:Coatomer subunit beta' n=1 Tax=Smittium mucronatum TaxID=133383 RepID=A0A1R0H6F8_9FUNG|nr:Coatomer subunit beta' [Smittium mucronatum]